MLSIIAIVLNVMFSKVTAIIAEFQARDVLSWKHFDMSKVVYPTMHFKSGIHPYDL